MVATNKELADKQKNRKPEYLFNKKYMVGGNFKSQDEYESLKKAGFPFFLAGFESRQDEVDELRAQLHEKNTILERVQNASNDLLKEKIDLDKIGTDLEQVNLLKIKFIQAVQHLRGLVEENGELKAELQRMEENRRGRAKSSKAVKKTAKVKK